MQIVYVGPLNYGATCFQRMNAMQALGHDITPINTETDEVMLNQKRLVGRIIKKIFGPQDLAKCNSQICDHIMEHKTDVIWLDKALTINHNTLKFVRKQNSKIVIVGYSPDDMAGKHNQSIAFLKSLPYYDIYFTTKSYGVKELTKLGCNKVVLIGNAFDPLTHFPRKVSSVEIQKYGGPVGFIGDYEEARASIIYFLAQNGIKIRVWGPNWERKMKFKHTNIKIEGIPLLGEEYAKAICSFDINLGFLRKINRDLQTTRTIEIPACGSFMLMERTNEHLTLFEEGIEAEYFSTKEELLAKVNYYLLHIDKRKSIARAGRQRCLVSGYSNLERIKYMLNVVEHLL